MRIYSILFLILVFLLSSCTLKRQKEIDVDVKITGDTVIINNSSWEEEMFIKNVMLNYDESIEKEPVFLIDSLNKTLYLYNERKGLIAIDLNSSSIINAYDFISFQRNERNFEFKQKDNYILFSSNARLFLLDKSLNLKAALIDSIKINHSQIGDKMTSFSYYIQDEDIKVAVKHLVWDKQNKERVIKDTSLIIPIRNKY